VTSGTRWPELNTVQYIISMGNRRRMKEEKQGKNRGKGTDGKTILIL
jgi:hypothetical protein